MPGVFGPRAHAPAVGLPGQVLGRSLTCHAGAQGHRPQVTSSQATGHKFTGHKFERHMPAPAATARIWHLGGPFRAQDVVCISSIDTRCCVKNKKSYPQIILK